MLGTVKECERNIKKPQSQNAEICQVHPSILRDYQLVDRPLGLNSSYRVRGSPFPLPQCFQLLSTCETPTGETGSTGHTRANLWPRCAREIHCKPMQTMRFFSSALDVYCFVEHFLRQSEPQFHEHSRKNYHSGVPSKMAQSGSRNLSCHQKRGKSVTKKERLLFIIVDVLMTPIQSCIMLPTRLHCFTAFIHDKEQRWTLTLTSSVFSILFSSSGIMSSLCHDYAMVMLDKSGQCWKFAAWKQQLAAAPFQDQQAVPHGHGMPLRPEAKRSSVHQFCRELLSMTFWGSDAS